MVNCKRIQDVLSDYIEGSVTGENRKDIEDHIQSCLSCKNLHERIRKTMGLLGSLPEISPTVEFDYTLRAKIRAERSREYQRIRIRSFTFPILRPWPAFAMSLTIVAVAVGFFLFRGTLFQDKLPPVFTEGKDQRKIERVNTPSESTYVLTPPDMRSEDHQIPNYILSTFSPQTFDQQRASHSPSGEYLYDDLFPSKEVLLNGQRYEQRTVRYILPLAPPQATMKTVTFNP